MQCTYLSNIGYVTYRHFTSFRTGPTLVVNIDWSLVTNSMVPTFRHYAGEFVGCGIRKTHRLRSFGDGSKTKVKHVVLIKYLENFYV